jgi:hypothetical protein
VAIPSFASFAASAGPTLGTASTGEVRPTGT